MASTAWLTKLCRLLLHILSTLKIVTEETMIISWVPITALVASRMMLI